MKKIYPPIEANLDPVIATMRMENTWTNTNVTARAYSRLQAPVVLISRCHKCTYWRRPLAMCWLNAVYKSSNGIWKKTTEMKTMTISHRIRTGSLHSSSPSACFTHPPIWNPPFYMPLDLPCHSKSDSSSVVSHDFLACISSSSNLTSHMCGNT
jgi:hypothetical protein